MAKSIRIRALEISGKINLKAIISHPMESGTRKMKKTGKKVPAHFIKEVIVSRNKKIVMEAFWGSAISRNPYLSFEIPGKKGDLIELSWLDSRGDYDTAVSIVA
ncbi:MAG: sulfur-oxidizing protein SoxZ [Planctomycetota bacterium]|jgi:sulfur-oxidizing protein SoxZ